LQKKQNKYVSVEKHKKTRKIKEEWGVATLSGFKNAMKIFNRENMLCKLTVSA
jgi:hypothetical protein